jgi:hypothetical protein
MVLVRLEQDWTDADGTTHSAGEMVDVDAGTLADLQASGVVAEASWVGPTGTDPNWVGPTGDEV